MRFCIDAHALLWNLEDSKRLSNSAKETIDAAESIYIPTIVLLEVHSILEKRKEEGKFIDFLDKLLNQSKFTVYPLSIEVIKEFVKIERNEMHDRIVIATAKLLSLPIITKDENMTNIYPKVIW